MNAASRTRRGLRYQRLREIEQMDPEVDYQQIWVLDLLYEFPWDLAVGNWLAFYNTLAPPDDARMLVRTGEMVVATQRRLDQMASLLWEMNRNGFAHPRGKAAVRQMNRIHKNSVRHVNTNGEQWTITNEQYLFVLATTLVTPQRWLDRYGWRPVSPHERRAAFLFIQELGQHMGLHDVPNTYQEFERFHDAYEAVHVIYTPEATQLWSSTQDKLIDVLTYWLPVWLHPIGRRIAKQALPALLSAAQRRAFGVPTPSRLLSAAVHTALKTRSLYVWSSTPRMEPAAPDLLPTPTYPAGDYEISKVGPEHSV